jgi:phosphotransferase system enzyme I (PtsI)
MEYRGIGVSSGMIIASSLVLKDTLSDNFEEKMLNNDYEQEKNKVKSIINSLSNDYDAIINNPINKQDVIDLAIAYQVMITAPSLYSEICSLIDNERLNAAGAIKKVLNDKANKMTSLENNYFKERALDIKDMANKMIKMALNIEDINLKEINKDTILIANEITPSMLLSINNQYLKGIVSEIGSKTSHVAILAKSIGIPAVFGINDITNLINDNEIIYLDGNKGLLINNLTEEMILSINEKIKNHEILMKSLQEMVNKKAVTTDGKHFEVASNAGDINDLNKIISVNPDGIGLFRSEFIYMDKDTVPSEDEQFDTYKKFAEAMGDRPLIIRTLDIGGDKKIASLNIEEEKNSFLGYRAIRYCIDHKDIFKDQLRAILRASYYGNVMIMFPMVSSIEEIRILKQILEESMKELDIKNVLYNKNIKIGIMTEVPSVAIIADLMIDEVDFFSIGTNDLIQYTLAVDRTNKNVSELYDSYNPAVIRLIKNTIDACKNGKFVGMCGEMAADPYYIVLLVGLGLNEFSVNVNSVLKVKKYISMLNYNECKEIVSAILKLRTGEEIEKILIEYANRVFGKYLEL